MLREYAGVYQSPRIARRVEIGRHEDVRFSNGDVQLALRILPRANHMQLEAKAGTNAETPSLHRFVPEYFTAVRDWLAQRIRGFDTRKRSEV